MFVHIELLVKVTSQSLTRAFTSFREAYQNSLAGQLFIHDDDEFTTRPTREIIEQTFPGSIVIGDHSQDPVSTTMRRRWQRLRFSVDRYIGRLSLSMSFQHPHVRGTTWMVIMTSFTALAALMVTVFAVLSGRPQFICSVTFLRR